MIYQEAIDFLFSALPMYQRQGSAAYKNNLDNTLRLDEYFSHPHQQFPSIHVAGTNGKGSISHMLASVLQASGFRTGLYTSPHLLDFRERIKIDGQPIPREEVSRFVTDHRSIIDTLLPSFFEMTVAMAFDYFARQHVEVAVIETGLGGRLDSTNIINPVLSIISNISRDHTAFLGSEITSIAREKGGIIKAGVPLVIGQTESPVSEVLLSMAREKNAAVTEAHKRWKPRFQTMNRDGSTQLSIEKTAQGKEQQQESLSLRCDLSGSYQQENIITAYTALEELQGLGWTISAEHIASGLAAISTSTGLMGRWQTIGHNPRSICDTAHNHHGIAAVIRQIMQTPWKKLHMVWGMVDDKDLADILPLLPTEASYYFTPSSVPRSLDPHLLAKQAATHGLKGTVYTTVKEAYLAAEREAKPDDMIFSGGSTFVVADLLLMKF